MKRIVFFFGLVILMGGAGFAAGQYFAPTPQDVAMQKSQRETLYKLPLGRFTVQVVKPERFFNIRFKLDVFIAGAANFERMNGGISRNRMRENVMRHLSTMVETTLWVAEKEQKDLDPEELAMTIARKLYQTYPMVRSAQIMEFATSRVNRSDL